MAIDLERAMLLMQVIKEASQHGPIYNRIASEAQKELAEMLKTEAEKRPATITPPAGPADGLVLGQDGKYYPRQEPRAIPSQTLPRDNPERPFVSTREAPTEPAPNLPEVERRPE